MSNSNSSTARSLGDHIVDGFVLFGGFLGLLWALEAVDVYLLDQYLNRFGIIPRSVDGITGIFVSPFLHSGFPHLSANSIPLALLGFVIYALRGLAPFVFGTLAITILGGLGVWLVGQPYTVHIGASGLIFGYLGFLLAIGFFERSVQAVAISIIIGVVYGGLVWGVLPGQPGVSWEGHLFGFLAGVLYARFAARRAS